jgi:2-methylcitrate dehydratase PrpD
VLWADADLLSVVDRIVPYAHAFVPEQPTLSCRLDITLTDGRVLSHTQRGFRGHPDNPDTDDDDDETKFLDNVDGVVEPSVAREIVELAGALDKLDDVTGLMRLTAGS